jgi:hypothetical protein
MHSNKRNDEGELEKPQPAPSLLTAREFEAREPAKPVSSEDAGVDPAKEKRRKK